MIENWTKCECCKTALPDDLIETKEYRKYEDSEPISRKVCKLCLHSFRWPAPESLERKEKDEKFYSMYYSNRTRFWPEVTDLMPQYDRSRAKRIRKVWMKYLESL